MRRWDYNYLFPIRCYLDSEGHETNKKMRFVDMCIEVDSHISHWNDKDSEGNWIVDKDREFNLIYSVCLMLASKAKLCADGREYDDFAYYLAYDVFDKIERPRDINNPIKSILNYIKSIMRWRIMMFKDLNRQKIYDPLFDKRWGDGTLKGNIIERIESSKKELTIEDVRAIINDFSRIIYKNIPDRFTTNKVVRKYIYMSVCMTLIKLFSVDSPKKNPMLNKEFEIVIYKLDQSYANVVKLVINKSLLEFADEIKDTIDKFKVGDIEYEMLMNSVFGGSDRNEEYYTLD